MKRIKVKLIGDGSYDNSYRVNLPNYMMDCKRDLSGNPIKLDPMDADGLDSADYVKMECYVLVPDDETKMVGNKIKLNQQKIRTKYKKNWSKFKASDVEL